ncbi:MAG: pyridoxamine 5'-phosphate oxidase family protein [Solirubrobacterales bacterium]
MTSTLPQEVQDVFGSFVTTEFTTVDARGQPIAWPVTPYYKPGAATIDVSTGVGYPKKAQDARRNPQVSLLFSDATGSGIESGIRVLVHGTAEVDDRDLKANRERYDREGIEKLPATRKMLPPKAVRGLFSWYFERIYVKVRPERVFVWPDGDPASEPTLHDAHLEEVRSGHTEEETEAHAPAAGGEVAWDGRIEELGRRYGDAVVAWVAPDGFPLAARLPVECDAEGRRVRIGAEPAGLPLLEGRACLAAHSHSPDFSWQENFQVRGDLVRESDGWTVVPHKLIGGFELPDESMAARYRRNLGKSIRFYRKRRELLKQRRG